jgi:serine/threonine-protein kinase
VAAKAMRKEPADRYASVGALILDLQRWLDQRPVSVRAEDWRHRTHLWIRRNAAVVTGGVLVLCALSAGLGVSLWQRNEAQAAARQSEAVTKYLTEVLSAASPDQNGGQQPTVLALLDAKRKELPERFKDQPEVKTRIYATLTDSYFAQQRFGVAAEMAEARLALAREAFGLTDPRTDDAAKSLASVHTSVTGVKPVVDLLEPVLPRTDARFGPLSEEATSIRMNLLVAYARLGRFSDAYRLLAELKQAFAALYPPGSMNASKLTNYESIVYTTAGRMTEALALLESTRPLWNATRPEDMRPALVLERNFAFTYWRLASESMAEATARSEDLIRRWDALARSGNHGSTLMRQQLAWYLQQMGQFAAARHELELAQALTESAGAEDAITGLLRRIALLEGQVLAQGRPSAADVDAAADLHRRLNESPLIGDVRRAEGLLSLGRIALASGAGGAGRQLAEAIVAEHDQLQRYFTQARNLRSRLGLFKARVAGTDDAWLAATAERVAYFKSLTEPQGLVGWIAHMQRACALRAAGQPWQPALAEARRLQPPRLLALTPQPHPLLDAARRLETGDAQLPRDCDWRF